MAQSDNAESIGTTNDFRIGKNPTHEGKRDVQTDVRSGKDIRGATEPAPRSDMTYI